jgi:putative methionine-R-sulfoxide reductase with GAF domain
MTKQVINMVSRLRRLIIPAPAMDEEDTVVSANLLNIGLVMTLLAGVLIPLAVPLPDASSRYTAYAGFIILDMAALGLMLFARRGQFRTVGQVYPLLLWGMFTLCLFLFTSLQDAAVGGYFSVLIVTAVLSGTRATLVLTLFSILSLTGVYAAKSRGSRIISGHVPSGRASLIILILLLVGAAWLLSVTVHRIRAAYEQARQNQRALMKANRGLRARETVMTARTHELETATAELVATRAELQQADRKLEHVLRKDRRRADLLQASAQVSRAIARVRDVDLLLPLLTRLISRHLGFYHVGIFLLDDTGRYAVLRAANSEGGQRMLARAHRLAVGSQGIVGYATGTGQARIARDVGVDATYFDNPELSRTRSEMAIPLHIENDIIGALDVQSAEPAAFDEDDVNMLTILADQVAIAIENARLFQQTQAALNEAQESYRRYLRQEWDSFVPRIVPERDDTDPFRG